MELPNNSDRTMQLSARMESFDSFWQSPEDVEKGYDSFHAYYRANYIPLIPDDKKSSILVISCGPGYLLNTLRKAGYEDVVGIDSDQSKIEFGLRRELNCITANAFSFLESATTTYDVIIPEQELNHLTIDEILNFLSLCRARLNPRGVLLVYGLNGANPLVGAENLAQNIDHFNTFTEHSLLQLLSLAGFKDI